MDFFLKKFLKIFFFCDINNSYIFIFYFSLIGKIFTNPQIHNFFFSAGGEKNKKKIFKKNKKKNFKIFNFFNFDKFEFFVRKKNLKSVDL